MPAKSCNAVYLTHRDVNIAGKRAPTDHFNVPQSNMKISSSPLSNCDKTPHTHKHEAFSDCCKNANRPLPIRTVYVGSYLIL